MAARHDDATCVVNAIRARRVARRVQSLRRVQPDAAIVGKRPEPETVRRLGPFRILVEQRTAGAGEGGDFCLCALRTPTRLAVVIGDACGRGREGARLLPLILPAMQALLRSGESPARLLSLANQALTRDFPVDRFVTAVAFELDLTERTLIVSSAAHVPLLLRCRGDVRVAGVPSGPPLGLLEDSQYADENLSVSHGDLAVLMTDGVLEAVESDLLAMPKLRALLSAAPEEPDEVHRFLLQGLDSGAVKHRLDDMLLASLALLPDVRPSLEERRA